MYGLASATSWGAGDFSGGLATRRAPVFTVAAVSKLAALATMLIFAWARAERIPAVPALAWAGTAGLAGALGLVSLYQALAVGVMGIAAPVSALVAAAMPVVFAALSEGLPTAWQLAGFGLALVAVWFVSRPAGPALVRDRRRPRGLRLATLAGLGFGAFYIFISKARTDSVFWPLAASQLITLVAVLAAAGALALARRAPGRPARGGKGQAGGRDGAASTPSPVLQAVLLMLLAGALDGGGNAFFLLAEHAGRLDVAAVLASLYPASTVVLARVVLNERVSPTQAVGIVAALASIPLIVG